MMKRQKKFNPISAISGTGVKHHERRKEQATRVASQAIRPAAGDHRLRSGKASNAPSEAKIMYERMDELLQSRAVSETVLHRKASASSSRKSLFHRESIVTDSSKANLHPSLRRAKKKEKKEKKPLNLRKEEEQYMQELSLYHQREYLAKSTHFSYEEIGHLQAQFNKIAELSGTPGEMKRLLFQQMFVDVFGVTDNVMLDNMFRYFDADGEGSVSCTEWIQNLSTILRGTLEEQVAYVYKIYDLNGDGGIGREEIRLIISESMNSKHRPEADTDDEDPHEHLTEVVELVCKRLEEPGTGQITLQSFYEAVKRDPLDLQCLGQCLPDPRKAKAYLCLLTNNPYSFTQNYSLPYKASYPDEAAKYEPRRSHVVSHDDSIMMQMFSYGATVKRLSDGKHNKKSNEGLGKRVNYRSSIGGPRRSSVHQPMNINLYH